MSNGEEGDDDDSVHLPFPNDLLRQSTLPVPSWLKETTEFTDQTARDFLGSRAVFYPGSGDDGDAFRLFGGTHSAHCFVHADYNLSPAVIADKLELRYPDHVKGYEPILTSIISAKAIQELFQVDMHNLFKSENYNLFGIRERLSRAFEMNEAIALWAVLQRTSEYDEAHGPVRLAFLHIQAEAVWVFWNLWAPTARAPFAILLQDHGFGGNCARFGGAESPLYQLASKHSALPNWLLVGKRNTDSWPG